MSPLPNSWEAKQQSPLPILPLERPKPPSLRVRLKAKMARIFSAPTTEPTADAEVLRMIERPGRGAFTADVPVLLKADGDPKPQGGTSQHATTPLWDGTPTVSTPPQSPASSHADALEKPCTSCVLPTWQCQDSDNASGPSSLALPRINILLDATEGDHFREYYNLVTADTGDEYPKMYLTYLGKVKMEVRAGLKRNPRAGMELPVVQTCVAKKAEVLRRFEGYVDFGEEETETEVTLSDADGDNVFKARLFSWV